MRLESTSRSPMCARWGRPVALGIAALVLLIAFSVLAAVYGGAAARGEVGYDFGLYQRIASYWTNTGDAYFPRQFDRAYTNAGEVNLYPPLALYLFVPFLWLPAILWWVVPMAIVAWSIWYWRPAAWSWPLLAAIAAGIPFAAGIVYGNSSLWAVAALSLALRWPAAAWLLAWKPPLLLFALPFAVHRAWWIAAFPVLAASLPFGTLWLDWLRALQLYRGETALYAASGWILLVAPFVIRAAATRAIPRAQPGTVDDVPPDAVRTKVAA